jgi:hypothetical protein
MAIGKRPPMSFAIANNLLAPNIKATNLRISPQATTKSSWNNFENHEDGFYGMNHPKKCSYTILKSSPKNKWGVVVKAWANKVLSKTKVYSC